MSKIKITIDGKKCTGTSGDTILQIARAHDIEIPTLCYDDRLQTYGACGLCVVQIKGSPKLARSCATTASDGMEIDTMSENVVASRKVALELLMSDHVGDCKAPCQLECPGNTDCQGYVGLIGSGEFEEAIKTIKDQLPMPASIGRVCPHPCETACRRQLVEEPIAIAQLKYFAADQDLQSGHPYMPKIESDSGKKIAIVGGGPGGLSSAFFLRQKGHAITVFDQMPKMGGMLRYGIPEYRLPKTIVDQEVHIIEQMGVNLKNNWTLGKDQTLEELQEEYDAILLATGAWKSSGLRCEGEELEGVLGGIDFLRDCALGNPEDLKDKNVAIIGGGNTAMDASRTAIRLGAKNVYTIYRRTRDEMPAEEIELIEADEEGVIFKYLLSPIKITGNHRVEKIQLQKMELGKPDQSGRRRPVPIEGAMEELDVDYVIAAIGQKLNPRGMESVKLTDWKTIRADAHSFMTNLEKVFAIGDATNDGADIAIAAIGEAKRSSAVIQSYLEGNTKGYYKPFFSIKKNVTEKNFEHKQKVLRAHMPHLKPEDRKSNFKEVNRGFSIDRAIKEGTRCLECGCMDVYDCKLITYAQEYDVEPKKFDGRMHHREQIEQSHPFIHINPDKCILCSSCIRTCEEVLGLGIFGLVDRGFESMVSPAFDLPLEETNCISCGECVSVCPTGALQEVLAMEKQIPLPPERTKSTCTECSLGCSVVLNTKREHLIRVESDEDQRLCVKGRFSHNVQAKNMIDHPLIRFNGELVVTSWENALDTIAKRIKEVGGESIGFVTAPIYPNEDYMALKEFAKTLGTKSLRSFSAASFALKRDFGVEASTATYVDLQKAKNVLIVATDLMKDYAVMGMKLYDARRDRNLVSIHNKPCFSDEWMNQAIVENDLEKAFCKLPSYTEDLAILYDVQNLSKDAIRYLANKYPFAKFLELTPGANTQGARDLGIAKCATGMKRRIERKELSTVFLFGEKPEDVNLDQVEFLVVYDTHLQEGIIPDVVLPSAQLQDLEGSITSAQSKVHFLQRATDLSKNLSIHEVIAALVRRMDQDDTPYQFNQLQKQVSKVSGYEAIKKNKAFVIKRKHKKKKRKVKQYRDIAYLAQEPMISRDLVMKNYLVEQKIY